MGHEPQGLANGLSNQQSVKRVEMMHRQVLDGNMVTGYLSPHSILFHAG